MLRHKVFVGASSCSGNDYTSYNTPFGCYNTKNYSGVESWDRYDEILEWDNEGRPTWYRRIYYSSQDESCQDQIEGVSFEGSFGGCSVVGDKDSVVSEEETLTW